MCIEMIFEWVRFNKCFPIFTLIYKYIRELNLPVKDCPNKLDRLKISDNRSLLDLVHNSLFIIIAGMFWTIAPSNRVLCWQSSGPPHCFGLLGSGSFNIENRGTV